MLYRIWLLLKEVYHYEKHSTLDSDYLRQVLTLAVVVLFALNFSCNGLDKPVVFVLTGLTSLVLLMVEWLLPRAKNEKHLVMFSNTALIFMGLLLLVWNENDGFQNLWFFLMPATLRGCRARPSRCCPASSLWLTSPTATAAGARRTPKSPRPSASVPDMRSTHSAWKSCAECSLKGRKKEDAPCRTKR